MKIKVIKDILQKNEFSADSIRELAKENRWFLINVMGSPGAGKTSFIRTMINAFKDKFNIAVIEGDVASTIDAEEISKLGVKVLQINTGGACHLVADSINEAILNLNPGKNTIIFIENIGNLICPSSFDLGENMRVVISSAAEGDDKPYKYPIMFESSDVVVLSKIDVAEVIGFDMERYIKGLKAIKGDNLNLFKVSFKTSEGLNELEDYFSKLFSSYFNHK
ncbi:hydrogenase nickel incorporation protein HypB [Caldicellulosiruptor morganii]|nr:hydrogenase nickel incorporation protein HypB [Caldicellulosiruptor morganii]